MKCAIARLIIYLDMKTEFETMLEKLVDKVYSVKFQAKAMLITFGMLGIGALAGAYYNLSQLIICALCAIMCTISYNELKK